MYFDIKNLPTKFTCFSFQAFEYKEQLKVVGNDLTHLSDTNKVMVSIIVHD